MNGAKKTENIKYQPTTIEPKWQKMWEQHAFYQAKDFDKKQKFFILIEFPYPSGAGLHVGHVRSWSAMDAYARKKRMEGKNVLYPIGWDAFGLPAENYAIKMGVHPSQIVPQNIARFKEQCQSLGLSFDWSREINTTDPKYYKWTQWIFLKFLEKGLAYQADVPVNWCPSCKTTLADEEVLPNGLHERCNKPTEKRMQKQWLLAITKYAQRLLDDLKTIDYPEMVAVQQVNWIGKSEGITFTYKVKDMDIHFEMFDSVPQTFHAQSFTVIAPEHPKVYELVKGTEHEKPVMDFVDKIKKKKIAKKFEADKEMEGIFTGRYIEYTPTKKMLPIWVASFVIADYGTGVVNASAHDERDFEFAKKYNIPLTPVMFPKDKKEAEKVRNLEYCYFKEPEGILEYPEEFRGRKWGEVRKDIITYIEEKGYGKRQAQYHLRDWVFSRQHYWGEPIPVIHCKKCGVVPVPEKDLPVELPFLEKYEPTTTGESPLALAMDWLNVPCPKCGEAARRETDTMPNWAGSNWYFLRYLDPHNDTVLADRKKMDYWMPVDIYQGGFEHTTLHLLYSRFVYKLLYDIGVVPTAEPYAKRRVHGIVLGPDGKKMSKSFGNVINSDEIVKKFGADTLRVYEMFMGPFDQTIAWSEESVEGCFRFLKRTWHLGVTKGSAKQTSINLASKLQKTIKKVDEDMERMKFNTAVASMMEFINDWQADEQGLAPEDLKQFLLILSPFAPHMTEELWQQINADQNPRKSIHLEEWPSYNQSQIAEEEIVIVVEVNGKVRETLTVQSEKLKVKSYIEQMALESANVQKHLSGKDIKKVVYIEGKIINLVTKR